MCDSKRLCLYEPNGIVSLIIAAVGHLDRKTLFCSVPAVCRMWREVCKCHIRGVGIYLRVLEKDLVEISTFIAGAEVVCGNFRHAELRGVVVDVQATNDALSKIVAGRPHLVSLDVHSSDVTEVGLANVAAACPLLDSLNIARCWRVPDVALEKIARGRPRLVTLNSPAGPLGARLKVGIRW